MNSGYSKTPLEKKLGLKDGFRCCLINPPTSYLAWFKNLPLLLERVKSAQLNSLDFVHLFVTAQNALEEEYKKHLPFLKSDGMFWISWPKGSSSLSTELKREPIRDFVLAHGLVDVKVAAIDDDWSGLKFVYRLKNRL